MFHSFVYWFFDVEQNLIKHHVRQVDLDVLWDQLGLCSLADIGPSIWISYLVWIRILLRKVIHELNSMVLRPFNDPSIWSKI